MSYINYFKLAILFIIKIDYPLTLFVHGWQYPCICEWMNELIKVRAHFVIAVQNISLFIIWNKINWVNVLYKFHHLKNDDRNFLQKTGQKIKAKYYFFQVAIFSFQFYTLTQKNTLWNKKIILILELEKISKGLTGNLNRN